MLNSEFRQYRLLQVRRLKMGRGRSGLQKDHRRGQSSKSPIRIRLNTVSF